MIGKPEWFTYRLFGWGIRPKTKEGWLYIAAFVALLLVVGFIPMGMAAHAWLLGIIVAVLLLDTLHIMVQLPKVSDERENYHQLVIERNCSFAAIAALIIVAAYEAWRNGGVPSGPWNLPFDYGIAVVLIVMLVAKVASYAYVKAKM